MNNVIKFQSPFERLKLYDSSPEIMLCKAIITQAIIDASNISDLREPKKLEIEAKSWLFSENDYFKQICHGACMEPSYVRKLAKEAIKLQYNKKLELFK